MAIGTDVKAPYYILGADGNYHKLLNDNIAEQIEGVGRRPATAYEAGDVVASSTNSKLLLLCTQTGTTAETDLNIASKTAGEAITDGTVGWKLIQRYIDTTYFNPTGTIIAFAGNTLPDGYLLCDGSQVSRTTYKKLFDVIGTTYGAGDGTTTFTLPNLIDRFLEGSSAAGSYLEAGLPDITGWMRNRNMTGGITTMLVDGRLFMAVESQGNEYTYLQSGTAVGTAREVTFNASRSNPIYGNSTTVQPPAVTTHYIIKY